MTDLARTERAALCDLLDHLGPNAPTLCAGWSTSDLAAHLVLREGRPDAALGIVVKPLAGWTKHVQDAIAGHGFTRVVHRLRTGPPIWSPFAPPPLDEAANNVEFFVHHEDVRRAQPGWTPRVLGARNDDLLWRRATHLTRPLRQSTSGGIALMRSDTGARHVVRAASAGQPTTTFVGAPSELVLYLFGRRDHALVEQQGDPDALALAEPR